MSMEYRWGWNDAIETALTIVENEPELEGYMPDSVEKHMKVLGLQGMLRLAVKLTKKNISDKLAEIHK